jgi:hypothetical protein
MQQYKRDDPYTAVAINVTEHKEHESYGVSAVKWHLVYDVLPLKKYAR